MHGDAHDVLRRSLFPYMKSIAEKVEMANRKLFFNGAKFINFVTVGLCFFAVLLGYLLTV